MSTDLMSATAVDARWRAWRLRGAESDRRMAMRMRGVLLILAAAGLLVLLVQFV